jgi:hypothetical protein
MATLRRGIGRLIDRYAEDVIDKAEFDAVDVAENERELSLLILINRLEDFFAKVKLGLAYFDGTGMRQIVRIVIRGVEIDDTQVEIIFRVPPLDGPARPKSPSKMTGLRQYCTADRRTDVRPDQPQSSPDARSRALYQDRRRLRPPRHDAHRAQAPHTLNPMLLNLIFSGSLGSNLPKEK